METLYRKYRPIDFDTVVGQDAVTTTLRNQIKNGSITHAYLFSGTRGTGKTTIAKIFARAINCLNLKEGNPCNLCDNCKNSLDSLNVNIVEMDAASNNGINHIRNIKEAIEYPPVNNNKYKVFIIDEAHALSPDAAQALLKILEEPPEYVVYILATTDPNKLPETILTRCQKYNFKRIDVNEIVNYLKMICEKENILVDIDALEFIAEKSDGSMRESISKLDRCRSFIKDGKLTKEKVLEILGIVDEDEYKKLVDKISESNVRDSFIILSEILDKGKDILEFTNGFIWYLRNLLLAKDLKEPIETLGITKFNFDKLIKSAKLISKNSIIYYIEELSKALKQMKYDENRRVILETEIIRLATPESCFSDKAVLARLDKLENTGFSRPFTSVVEEKEKNKVDEKENKKSEIITEIKLPRATFDDLNKVIDNFKIIMKPLDHFPKTVLGTAKLIPKEDKNLSSINVLIDDEYFYNLITENNKKENLEKVLSEQTKEIIKKEVVFKIELMKNTKYNKNTIVKLDPAFDKIGMNIEIEDD